MVQVMKCYFLPLHNWGFKFNEAELLLRTQVNHSFKLWHPCICQTWYHLNYSLIIRSWTSIIITVILLSSGNKLSDGWLFKFPGRYSGLENISIIKSLSSLCTYAMFMIHWNIAFTAGNLSQAPTPTKGSFGSSSPCPWVIFPNMIIIGCFGSNWAGGVNMEMLIWDILLLDFN
jgi:hypothetical protein